MTGDNIGARVKIQREAKGLSRAELARRIEYSESAIKFLEKGKRNPSVDFLYRIGEELDVPIQYFLADRDESYIDKCNQWDSRFEDLTKEETAQLLAIELEYCRNKDSYDRVLAIAKVLLPIPSERKEGTEE